LAPGAPLTALVLLGCASVLSSFAAVGASSSKLLAYFSASLASNVFYYASDSSFAVPDPDLPNAN